ncbi:EAL domain-containing protein [Undibacterium sp.]|uniref:EAL domain-containing protein n=1 Tax=Undibacterium sp. TaxID=1914977 RepID=UPI0025F12D0F|nr:EAL domain-containing protein [Undibacterium sp.]
MRLRRSSRSFVVLIAVFSLACVLGYLVVRQAVNRTIEHQALTIAKIVASQATTARSVYAHEIVGKLLQDGFGPSVDSANKLGHVPIPAQFLKLVGQASSTNADKLYEYKPVSKWNLETSQGLADDFLRWAWPQLEAQDKPNPQQAIDWQSVSRFEIQNGRRVLRYLSADPVSQKSCASCHNAYEKTPEILKLRGAQGIQIGKQWQQHQLLGALSITIPLDKTELLAGSQINRTSIFIFAILFGSFVAIFWFNWRYVQQAKYLQNAQTQLEKSELEALTANTLLFAKQGVEQAFSELSTYMQAIDQHAIVSVADSAGRILKVNPKFVAISGFEASELIGQDHRILNSGLHPASFFTDMWKTIAQGEIWRGVICNRSKSGLLYWVDSAIVPMKDANGVVRSYISIRIDITERKKVEQEMLHMATHDGLTDLANRSLLRERMLQALDLARVKQNMTAVLFIDLDQFKAINDSIGHDVGDLLLIEVADRLRSCVRADDVVARQGGDEFIVFMPKIEGPSNAATLASKLQLILSEPFKIGERELYLGSSIGIAVSPQDGDEVDVLLKNSDTAMYQVKSAGRNHFMFFHADMNRLAVSHYAMTADLRHAIARDEFFLNFQPIVGVQSGQIESMEVLLRWRHPVLGLVSPVEFIPLAESSGLIVTIGEWVLRTACTQLQEWRSLGYRLPHLAINLSAIQIHHSSILQTVTRILAETGVAASALELEITEGCLMNNTDEVVATLSAISQLGVQISIDDFGTGYSSLSYLKRLPIDTLKIDRSFVMDIGDDQDGTAIVAAIIAMARSLNLKVIAEGVESAQQLAFLQAQECDQFQGYLYSKPLSAAEMRQRLLRA